MRILVIAAPILMLACNGKDGDTDPATGDTDPPTVACDATITGFTPANGAADVPRDTPVTIDFSGPVVAQHPWSIELAGVTGVATLAEDGLSATFVADAPLPPDTAVQVTAQVCDDTQLSAFTTVFGIDAGSLEGRTYSVSYGSVDFVSPALVNTLPDPADWILIQIDTVDATGTTVTALAGLGNGAVPEPDCLNTFEAGSADFSANPMLQVGPTDFVIPVDTDLVTIEDFEMNGRFEPGAGILADVTIAGMLDTRGITIINGVCGLSALSGVPCEACRCSPRLHRPTTRPAWT